MAEFREIRIGLIFTDNLQFASVRIEASDKFGLIAELTLDSAPRLDKRHVVDDLVRLNRNSAAVEFLREKTVFGRLDAFDSSEQFRVGRGLRVFFRVGFIAGFPRGSNLRSAL